MTLLLIIGIVVLIGIIIGLDHLSGRISLLEKKLENIPLPETHKKYSAKHTQESDLGHKDGLSWGDNNDIESKNTHHKQGTDKSAWHWIKEDWLVKLGAFLLLLAAGWFASFAIDNNWIGPIGRITLGIFFGTAMMGFGWMRMRSFVKQGAVFLIVGASIAMMTLMAGRVLYDFFTSLTVLVLTFTLALFVSSASIVYKRNSISLAGLILGSLAPIFAGTIINASIMTMLYISMIIIAHIWFTWKISYKPLHVVSVLVILVYTFIIGVTAVPADHSTLLFLINSIVTLIFVNISAHIVRNKSKHLAPELFSLVVGTLVLVSWILMAGADHLQSIMLMGWTIAFVTASYILTRLTKNFTVFYIYSAVGVALLFTATTIELQGPALIIALTAEAAILPWLVQSITKNITSAKRASVLLVIPAIYGIESVMPYRFTGDDAVTLSALVIASATTGFLFFKNKDNRNKAVYVTWFSIASAYLYVLLWNWLRATDLEYSVATGIALVIYATIGLVTYIMGRMKDHKVLLWYGSIMIGLVIVRLLLIDIWQLTLIPRIITFFIIGLLFMSTVFLKGSKK